MSGLPLLRHCTTSSVQTLGLLGCHSMLQQSVIQQGGGIQISNHEMFVCVRAGNRLGMQPMS
jgi:hypothetical protein